METLDYESLNNKLGTLVYREDSVSQDDIMFEDKMCMIILDNTPSNMEKLFHDDKCYKCIKKMPLSTSKEICLNFFTSLNPKYGKMLKELYENDGMKFTITHDADILSLITEEDDITSISISVLENINDVYAIAHEFMHYLNCRGEIETPISSYFTEGLSTYIELILADYLVKNYPEYRKDINKMRRNSLGSLYQYNYTTKIIIELIKHKIEGEVINKHTLYTIVKELTDNYGNEELVGHCLSRALDEIIDDPEEALIFHIRYSVALVFASYMYSSFKVEEILDLNDAIPNFSYEDVIDYLDLSFANETDFNLDVKDYDKLTKDYIKVLKGLW